MSDAAPKPPERTLGAVAKIAIAGAAVDAFMIGVPLASVVMVGFALAYYLPRALWSWRDSRVLKLRLAKSGVIVLAVALAYAYVRMDDDAAKERADTVVGAIKAYKSKNGRLPASLDELVPAYLPAIPHGRYALLLPGFHYGPRGRSPGPLLSYMRSPLTGARFYDFDLDEWYNHG